MQLAESRQLAAVALTDHDTTAGLAEAAGQAEKYPNLRFIPGVELSAKFSGGTLHILGLGIDPASKPLAKLLERLLSDRKDRNPKMADLLVQLGVDVTIEDARAVAGDGTKFIGRLHFAEAMRRKGYVKTIAEAFKKYIGPGCPAYVDKERTSSREIIAGIRKAGGVAVLAHPPQLNYQNSAQLRRILEELVSGGLGGIEAYHNNNSPQQTRDYLTLARRYGLTVAGGSDFHGLARPDAKLGYPRVPLAAISGDLAEMIGHAE